MQRTAKGLERNISAASAGTDAVDAFEEIGREYLRPLFRHHGYERLPMCCRWNVDDKYLFPVAAVDLSIILILSTRKKNSIDSRSAASFVAEPQEQAAGATRGFLTACPGYR